MDTELKSTLRMKDKITVEIPFTKNTPEVRAAIQAIADGVSADNLKAVHNKLNNLGPDKLNDKLKKGLGFI